MHGESNPLTPPARFSSGPPILEQSGASRDNPRRQLELHSRCTPRLEWLVHVERHRLCPIHIHCALVRARLPANVIVVDLQRLAQLSAPVALLRAPQQLVLIVGDHIYGICKVRVSDSFTPRSRNSFRLSDHSHVCNFRNGFHSATDNNSASPA